MPQVSLGLTKEEFRKAYKMDSYYITISFKFINVVLKLLRYSHKKVTY